MRKVIKGKGMCSQCNYMENRTAIAYHTGKEYKYKFCNYYASKCKSVARNCLGSK